MQGVRANQLVGYGLVIGLQRHGRQPAQLAVHRAVAAIDARPHGHQRAQLQRAHAQRRGRHRHGRSAGLRRPGRAHRRHRLLARRCHVAGGRLADPHAADRRRQPDLRGRRKGRWRSPASPSAARRRRSPRACPRRAASPTARSSSARPPAVWPTRRLLVLELRNPDFKTAVNVADAINAHTRAALRRQGRARARPAHRLDQRPFFINRDALHRRYRRARRGDGRAGARRHRRAHRHDRDRQGRADLHGRRRARQPDGAGHRERRRSPSPCRSPRARRSSRPRPWSPPTQKGGNFAIVSGHQPADAGGRPQPDRPEAAPASSPSCRPSSRRAPCRPTWWCNDRRPAASRDGPRRASDRARAHAVAAVVALAAGVMPRASRRGRRTAGRRSWSRPFRRKIPRPRTCRRRLKPRPALKAKSAASGVAARWDAMPPLATWLRRRPRPRQQTPAPAEPPETDAQDGARLLPQHRRRGGRRKVRLAEEDARRPRAGDRQARRAAGGEDRRVSEVARPPRRVLQEGAGERGRRSMRA